MHSFRAEKKYQNIEIPYLLHRKIQQIPNFTVYQTFQYGEIFGIGIGIGIGIKFKKIRYFGRKN